jgi:transporter family-2 protein
LAGAALPVQAGINVHLRGIFGNPVRASFVQFTVGALFLLALTLFARDPWPALNALARGPAWAWTGGILGALYVVSVIVLVPRLGSAVTFALIVAGQMGISLAIDQFGLFGLPRSPLSLARIGGGALLVAGVILIRR